MRVLLLADTHLGFDLPRRPRVERRRRGPDFFANFESALAPALAGEVDLVVHGGDLLYRSKVGRELVYRAFDPLVQVAASGVPVVVVPGNHERSAIPYPLLAAHADRSWSNCFNSDNRFITRSRLNPSTSLKLSAFPVGKRPASLP